MCRLRLQPITCTIVIFGMFIGQRSTLGNGLSGEPWIWQDSPKASPRLFSNEKNVIEQVKLLLQWMLIERWTRPSMLSSMCQHVTRLQFDRCAKKDSLCGTVMMAWIWHVWIEAMVFVPTAKAPPKAGATELSYNSLNLSLNLSMKDNTYYSGQHPCFGPNWFIQFCNTWRWIRYA